MPSCRHLEYALLILPEWGARGAYTQRVSFNAFFHGMKGYNRTSDRLYHEQEHPGFFPMATNVPIREFTSLWDFYNHIGYNWKTKTHTEPIASPKTK